jgi:hypothetical protein
VTVDGLLYLMVVDPVRASYGIDDYRFATAQLAQTTMRSEIGKIDLDDSFTDITPNPPSLVLALTPSNLLFPSCALPCRRWCCLLLACAMMLITEATPISSWSKALHRLLPYTPHLPWNTTTLTIL